MTQPAHNTSPWQAHTIRLRIMSPDEISADQGEVRYGIHDSPFGEIFLGLYNNVLCHLIFLSQTERQVDIDQAFVEISKRFLVDDFQSDQAHTKDCLDKIFSHSKQTINLISHGSDFQTRVWQALLQIPCGSTTSYGELARLIGKPKAARAIGNAVGANPISLLIPCHRVLRQSGVVGHYRWGRERKIALLKSEGAID